MIPLFSLRPCTKPFLDHFTSSTFLAFSPENGRISGEEGGVGAAERGCPALLEWNSKARAPLAAQHVNSQPANSRVGILPSGEGALTVL